MLQGFRPRPRERQVPQPEHRSGRSQRAQHSAAHKGPVSKPRYGQSDHADRQYQRLAQVNQRERFEAQVPLQQRKRYGLERRDDKGCAHGHHDERQLWSVKEPSQRNRDGAGCEQAGQPKEHRQAVELVDLLDAELADGQYCGSQAKLGEQRDQPEVDRGHAQETVVLRREQTGDDHPGYPAEPLAGPLGRRRPGDTAQERAVQSPTLGVWL